MVVAFKFQSNSKDLNRRMSNMVAAQMPFALSKALNDTARTLVKKNKQDMSMIFDNAVPWTLNAFAASTAKHGPIRAARKGDTKIYIRRKDDRSRRHYLEVQQDGGVRPRTGLETLIDANLATSRHVGTVSPTRNIKRSKTGAVSRGEVNKLLSALHLQRDKSTNSPIYGYSGKTKRSTGYFVPASTHPLSKGGRFGIYRRTSAGNAQKVLNISERRSNYKPKFRFYERMSAYGSQVFRKKLQRSLAHAIRTARVR